MKCTLLSRLGWVHNITAEAQPVQHDDGSSIWFDDEISDLKLKKLYIDLRTRLEQVSVCANQRCQLVRVHLKFKTNFNLKQDFIMLRRYACRRVFLNRLSNTRGHNYKLYKKRNNNNVRANFFAERIVNVWNRLPSEIVNFDTLNRTVKMLDLSEFLKCFQVFFKILNGKRLVQFISALLSCSPIVISISTFIYEIFELIKIMMMMK